MKTLIKLSERKARIIVSPRDLSDLRAKYSEALNSLGSSQDVYGIHSHYGHNVAQRQNPCDFVEHQLNLLHYLKTGSGPALDPGVVRRALRLQISKILRGYSAISPGTFERLLNLSNAAKLPRVPCFGSLGASGDLIPMAYAIAPIFTGGFKPQGPRDVIGLVNTNAMMSSLLIDLWQKSMQLFCETQALWLINHSALGWAPTMRDLAKSFEAVFGRESKHSFWLTSLGSLLGVLAVKANLKTKAPALPLQERYSIRCAPLVFVDMAENLIFARQKIERESLAVADNPIFLDGSFIHGGLFFTSALASAANLIQDLVQRSADLIDRQILLLVTPELSHGLAPNLEIPAKGHTKGLHQLASALRQQILGLGLPAYFQAFSAESHNQDILPATMASALKLKEALALWDQLLNCGFFVGFRAFDLRFQTHLSPKAPVFQAWPKFNHRLALKKLAMDFGPIQKMLISST